MASTNDYAYRAYNKIFEDLMGRSAECGVADQPFECVLEYAAERLRTHLAESDSTQSRWTSIPLTQLSEIGELRDEEKPTSCLGTASIGEAERYAQEQFPLEGRRASCVTALNGAIASRSRATAGFVESDATVTTTVFAPVLVGSGDQSGKVAQYLLFVRCAAPLRMEEWVRDDVEVVASILTICHARFLSSRPSSDPVPPLSPIEKEARRLLRHFISYRRTVRKAVQGGLLESIHSPSKSQQVISRTNLEARSNLVANLDWQEPDVLIGQPAGALYSFMTERDRVGHELRTLLGSAQGLIPVSRPLSAGLVHLNNPNEADRKVAIELTLSKSHSEVIGYFHKVGGRYYDLSLANLKRIASKLNPKSLNDVAHAVASYFRVSFPNQNLRELRVGILLWEDEAPSNGGASEGAQLHQEYSDQAGISEFDTWSSSHPRLTMVGDAAISLPETVGSQSKAEPRYRTCNFQCSKGICRFVAINNRIWAERISDGWKPVRGFSGESQHLEGGFPEASYEIAAPISYDGIVVGVLDVQFSFNEETDTEPYPDVAKRFLIEAGVAIAEGVVAFGNAKKANRRYALSNAFSIRHKAMLDTLDTAGRESNADRILEAITNNRVSVAQPNSVDTDITHTGVYNILKHRDVGHWEHVWQDQVAIVRQDQDSTLFIHLYEITTERELNEDADPPHLKPAEIDLVYANGKREQSERPYPKSATRRSENSYRIDSVVIAAATAEATVTFQSLTKTSSVEPDGKEECRIVGPGGLKIAATYYAHEPRIQDEEVVSELAIRVNAGRRAFIINYEVACQNFFDEVIIEALVADGKMCAAILRAAIAADEQAEEGWRLTAQYYNVREGLHDDSHAVDSLQKASSPDHPLSRELDYLLRRMRYNAIHSANQRIALPVPSSSLGKLVTSYPEHWNHLVRDQLIDILPHNAVIYSTDRRDGSYIRIAFDHTEPPSRQADPNSPITLGLIAGGVGAFAFAALLSGLVRNSIKHADPDVLKRHAKCDDNGRYSNPIRFRIGLITASTPTSIELERMLEEDSYSMAAFMDLYREDTLRYTEGERQKLQPYLNQGYVAVRITCNLLPQNRAYLDRLVDHAQEIFTLDVKAPEETQVRSTRSGLITNWHNALFISARRSFDVPAHSLERFLEHSTSEDKSIPQQPPALIFSVKNGKLEFMGKANSDDGLAEDEYSYTFFIRRYVELTGSQPLVNNAPPWPGHIAVMSVEEWNDFLQLLERKASRERDLPWNTVYPWLALGPWYVLVTGAPANGRHLELPTVRFTSRSNIPDAATAWQAWLDVVEAHADKTDLYLLGIKGFNDLSATLANSVLVKPDELPPSLAVPLLIHVNDHDLDLQPENWLEAAQHYVEFCPVGSFMRSWLDGPRDAETDASFRLKYLLATRTLVAVVDARFENYRRLPNDLGPQRPDFFAHLPSLWTLADCWRYFGVEIVPIIQFAEWAERLVERKGNFQDVVLSIHQGDVNGKLIGDSAASADEVDEWMRTTLGPDLYHRIVVHTEHGDLGTAQRWGVRGAGFGPIKEALLNGCKFELFLLLTSSRGTGPAGAKEKR